MNEGKEDKSGFRVAHTALGRCGCNLSAHRHYGRLGAPRKGFRQHPLGCPESGVVRTVPITAAGYFYKPHPLYLLLPKEADTCLWQL